MNVFKSGSGYFILGVTFVEDIWGMQKTPRALSVFELRGAGCGVRVAKCGNVPGASLLPEVDVLNLKEKSSPLQPCSVCGEGMRVGFPPRFLAKAVFVDCVLHNNRFEFSRGYPTFSAYFFGTFIYRASPCTI